MVKAMRIYRRRLLSAIAFLVTLTLVWVVAACIHELAHGLTAEALGGKFLWFSLWPGVQVYPHPGQLYEGEWGTSIAKAAYGYSQGWEDWRNGLVLLMGSGSNLLLAALALGGLWLFRPRGWPRFLLIAGVLMVEDMLLYAILPELFGLRHYLVFGGVKPEPVDGAALLGCPRPLSVVSIVLVSALLLAGLVAYLRRDRDRESPD